MKKDKLIHVRISEEQYQKLKKFAEKKDATKSQIIRGLIDRTISKLNIKSNSAIAKE